MIYSLNPTGALVADLLAVAVNGDLRIALVIASVFQTLEHLREHGATVAAGPWTHLFAVGPEVARERVQRQFEQRRDAIWEEDTRPGESKLASFHRRTRAGIEASTQYQRDMAAADGRSTGNGRPTDDGSADLVGFLPPLGKRLQRLEAMGAQLQTRPEQPVRPRTWSPLVIAAGWVVGLVLVAIILVLFLLIFACLAGLIYLALLFELALLAPPVILVHVLLR